MTKYLFWLLLLLPLMASCQTTSTINGKSYTTKKSYQLVSNQLQQVPEDSVSFVARKKLVLVQPLSKFDGRTLYEYPSKNTEGIIITRLCVVLNKEGKWRIKSL